jgi:phage gpG-like protein
VSSSFKRTKTRGGVEALKTRVKTPGTVDVGIIDAGEHPSGDITVAGIGFVHEFGTAIIPERSFIRSTIQDKKKELIEFQRKLLKNIIAGKMEVNQALGLIGEFMADAITQKIVAIQTPPNEPATIARKGSSNPLVDTGQLKNSITYEVNR